jgi:hypothetical protein
MTDPKIKPQLAAWGGDRRAVMADLFKYLDNQRAGRPNSLHLDADPVLAVQKRNIITDLLGGEAAKEALGDSRLSTKSSRDQPWRSYRLDRLNQMRDSSGDNFPIDYRKVKQNLMPFEVGRTLGEAGGDFPVDKVKPTLLDVGVKNEKLMELTSKAFSKLPRTVRASDGSEILLWNPEGGSIGRRIFHLGRDEESNRIVPSKVRWVPMIAETLREAPARIYDPKTQNRIYVRDYEGHGKHMVVVRPDGLVIDQGPADARLITQFPYTSGGNQEGMVIQWARPDGGSKAQHGDPVPAQPTIPSHASGQPRRKGEGQSQGNPSPTPTGSAVPEPRQSEFQGKSTESSEEVKPLPPGVTPTAVINHLKDQITTDLSNKLTQGGAPPALAREIASNAYSISERLVRRKSAPHERAYAMRAAALVGGLGPTDLAAIRDATIKGGTAGANAELKNRLVFQSATMPSLA